MWLDGGELMAIAGLDYSAGRILICPKCQDQLQTRMLKGVEVDVCPSCSGVYLDEGEMENLKALEPVHQITNVEKFMEAIEHVRMEFAMKLYKEGKKTHAEAAKIAGVSVGEFKEFVEKN